MDVLCGRKSILPLRARAPGGYAPEPPRPLEVLPEHILLYTVAGLTMRTMRPHSLVVKHRLFVGMVSTWHLDLGRYRIHHQNAPC